MGREDKKNCTSYSKYNISESELSAVVEFAGFVGVPIQTFPHGNKGLFGYAVKVESPGPSCCERGSL